MKRRDLLIGSGALAGGSLLPGLRQSALAQAKPSQMVIMTWGGLWGDAMRDGAGNAFEKETGIKIVQDRSGSPADRITKIKVNLADQKFDLVQLHDGLVPLATAQGVLEPLNKELAPAHEPEGRAVPVRAEPLGGDDLFAARHHLQHQAREDAADLLCRPVAAGVQGPDRAARHQPLDRPLHHPDRRDRRRQAADRRRGRLRDAEEDGCPAADLGEGHRQHHERAARRGRGDRPSLQVADLHREGLEGAGRVGLSRRRARSSTAPAPASPRARRTSNSRKRS